MLMHTPLYTKGDAIVTKTLSITQVRSQLLGLADALNRPSATGSVAVTKRGRPVLALLPWELYESLVETLEILGDEDLMKALRRSLKEARAGKTIPFAKVKRELGFQPSCCPPPPPPVPCEENGTPPREPASGRAPGGCST